VKKKPTEKMGFEPHRTIQFDFNNKAGWHTVGGREIYFRSLFEWRFAEYLEMLKLGKAIKDWAFEQTTFTFPDDKYLVDFDQLNNDGTFEYYECKGHWDARAKRKIQLLNKYRPEVQITLVFQSKRDMKKVSKKLASMCKRTCVFSKIRGLSD
jgi:hypothetical protein